MKFIFLFLLLVMIASTQLWAQPVITSQPVNQTVIWGGNATFSVTATDVGRLTYQWRLNGTNLPNNIITTFAGNGRTNFTGDGGAATNAGIYQPEGISFDGVGNLYITDRNNRIRKVATNGIITTVAGNGIAGFAGDGAAATIAKLDSPDGVISDAVGNLYISDFNNNRVRKVSTNGVINTVAGNGNSGFGQDGFSATNSPNSKIYGPASVAFGFGGDWFIADQYNNRIRKVSANGILTTVAGRGPGWPVGGFSGDGGAATNAKLYNPDGIALDAFGNLFIADQSNHRVRKVDTNGIITTAVGNGTFVYQGDGGAATNAGLISPYGLAFDSFGNLYISDLDLSRIFKVDTNGILSSVAGNGGLAHPVDGGAATNTSVGWPSGLAFDAMGKLYYADIINYRVRVIHFSGLPTLSLKNVDAAAVGNYSVFISGPSGSITSSVATLILQLPPLTPSFNLTDGLYTFKWGAVPNFTYQLQCATNLTAPVWVDLGSPITATSNSVSVTDATSSDGQRFYRVRLVP